MRIGIVGLGRMGGNIARRLMRAGHQCVVFDVSEDARAALSRDGATAAPDFSALFAALDSPRIVWFMLPAGEITERAIDQAATLMQPGDIAIDGGNSFWKDDIRRGRALAERGLHYVDVGTSGGVFGLDRGYCMMIGARDDVAAYLDPIFTALAPGAGDIPRTSGRESRDPRPEQGYLHAGPIGAGHFVKMIHNGIEYGIMQAYAEGFDILRNAASDTLPQDERLTLSAPDIAEVWRRGSVISSWLLDLTATALAKDPELSGFSGFVEDSGEGRWTLAAAIAEAVPADVLAAALFARFRSRKDHTFADKLLSAMRNEFGGHVEPAARPGT